MWTQCAQIDSFVLGCRHNTPYGVHAEDHIDACLDDDDGMESLLRAVAANVHYKRTGDSESADRMRVLVTPGDEIAPAWLLDSSTEYSRHIHRQKAYLHPTHRYDGGKGKDKASPKVPKAKKDAKGSRPRRAAVEGANRRMTMK